MMTEHLGQLNQQAISAAHRYMGNVAWLTVAFTLLVVGLFALNLAFFAAGVLPIWTTLVFMGVLTYMSYTPLHEAAHGNINGSRKDLGWLNDLCGYLVAPLIFVPYASHRREHLTHHRYTNQPGKDPDFIISNLSKDSVVATLTVFKFLWGQNTFFARYCWSAASLKERVIYCSEITFSLGWRTLFILWVDQPGAAVVIVFGYLLGGIFTAYWFAYRPHLPYKVRERYRNTCNLIMPRWMKPLEWFWLGQNLHAIHHLFPRVPFYRYHALNREIEPILRSHGTPIIGLFSRKPVAQTDN